MRGHAQTLKTQREVFVCRENMIASARPYPPVPPQNLHGKEGVDGSSSARGLHRNACKSLSSHLTETSVSNAPRRSGAVSGALSSRGIDVAPRTSFVLTPNSRGMRPEA